MNWAERFTPRQQYNPLVRQLVPLQDHAAAYFNGQEVNPVIIEAEYTKPATTAQNEDSPEQNAGLPNHPFGAIYRPDAVMSAHKDMADIIVRAAEILHTQQCWKLKVMDCLRTVEAQEAMQQVVRDNGWSDDYVSPPGYGPHPRGMAVDLVPVDGSTGKEIDMGAPFDHFAEKSNRDCMQLTAQQQDNRQTLNHAVFTAAEELGFSEKFIGHPQEWWDFRFTEPTWKAHEPIKESDLPENLRLVKPERIQSAAGRGR